MLEKVFCIDSTFAATMRYVPGGDCIDLLEAEANMCLLHLVWTMEGQRMHLHALSAQSHSLPKGQ